MRQQRRLAAVRQLRRRASVLRLTPVLRLASVLGLAVLGLPVLRLPVLVVGRAGLRRAVLVLRCAVLVLWGAVLLLRLVLVRLLLLRLRRAPLVLGLLRRAPRVGGGLLLLRLPVLLLPVLRLALLRLPVRGLAGLALPVLTLTVLVMGLLGHGRTPCVRLLLLRLRRAPLVLGLLRRAPGVGGGLLLLRLPVLLLPVLRLAVLRLPMLGLAGLALPVLTLTVLRLPVLVVGRAGLRAAVLLAPLLRPRRRGYPLRFVPARALLVSAATGARQVGPAAHAEQIARLERLVADRTVQGRHDTSPERTPARSSLDVRCSMSPLRGIPM
ncbi:hypothetical protein [Actinomadura sp. NPDC000929]|uniref:hypothetical protein n=1 Tax=Actinomadura sp. NPDC000929 TaxID=3154517 RepID=UPI003399C6F3